jgi:hypothetical protein
MARSCRLTGAWIGEGELEAEELDDSVEEEDCERCLYGGGDEWLSPGKWTCAAEEGCERCSGIGAEMMSGAGVWFFILCCGLVVVVWLGIECGGALETEYC